MLRAASLAALVMLSGAEARAPGGWEEIAWPFPRDAWPAGRAFRGDGIEVAIRPKLGFCNCTSGVTDDAEVDAVSDVDMIGPDFTAPAPGAPVQMFGLAGRARSYVVRPPEGPVQATGYALSSKCDLLVAVARGRNGADSGRVAALMETKPVADWIANRLGLAPTRISAR